MFFTDCFIPISASFVFAILRTKVQDAERHVINLFMCLVIHLGHVCNRPTELHVSLNINSVIHKGDSLTYI